MKTLNNNRLIVGNLGTNPETVNTANGGKTVRFSFASDQEIEPGRGEVKKRMEAKWVYAYGNLAQFIEKHVKKGSRWTIHGTDCVETLINKKGEIYTVQVFNATSFISQGI